MKVLFQRIVKHEVLAARFQRQGREHAVFADVLRNEMLRFIDSGIEPD